MLRYNVSLWTNLSAVFIYRNYLAVFWGVKWHSKKAIYLREKYKLKQNVFN